MINWRVFYISLSKIYYISFSISFLSKSNRSAKKFWKRIFLCSSYFFIFFDKRIDNFLYYTMIISHWLVLKKILRTRHDKSAPPDQKRRWKKKKSNHISRTFEIDSLDDRRWKRRKNIAWILIQGSTKIPELRVVFDTRVRFHDTATLSPLYFSPFLFLLLS